MTVPAPAPEIRIDPHASDLEMIGKAVWMGKWL